MARLALTVTQQAPNVPTSLTDMVAAVGSNTGVVFANDGRVRLVFVVSGGSSTYSINIGETVDGSQPPALTGTLSSGKTYIFEPFGPEISQQGANAGQVWVDLGTPANVSAGLLAA
jgi:hypothetical protein